ncbi:hypothetical protein D3C83_13630 [compost metagenome]
MARSGHGVRADRKQRAVGRLIRVEFARRCCSARNRALRAAIGEERDLAQPELDRRLGVRHVRHEGGAADLGAIEAFRLDMQVLGERHGRDAHLRCGGENAVHVGELEPALVECAHRRLRHEIDGTGVRCNLAQVRFRDADDGDACALQSVHFDPSAGVNTG